MGRNLGFHPCRLVYGLFDEIQDAHIAYPISSHCMKFQQDQDGGFIVEAATVQDPIGFSAGLSDENGPMWGEPLVEALRRYRYWNGVLMMVNDENNGRVEVTPDGGEASRPTSRRPSSSGWTGRSTSRARCSRPRARSRSPGPESSPRTCRAPAGWAATRPARW